MSDEAPTPEFTQPPTMLDAFMDPISFFAPDQDEETPAPVPAAEPSPPRRGQRGRAPVARGPFDGDSRGDVLLRFLEERRPQLAERLRSLRERSPEAFDEIIGDALMIRIEDALERLDQPSNDADEATQVARERDRERARRGGPPRGDRAGRFMPPAAPPPPDAPPPPPPPGEWRTVPPPRMDQPVPAGEWSPTPSAAEQERRMVQDRLPRRPSGRGFGPPPPPQMSDEERRQFEVNMERLMQQERDLEMRSEDLAKNARSNGSDGSLQADRSRVELERTLRDSFETRGQLRELQLRRIEAEIRAMQNRLEDLRRDMQLRAEQRDEIIRARMEELLEAEK